MKKMIQLSLWMFMAFALAFGGLTPARADDETPPADVLADTPTLVRAWDVAPGAASSYPGDLVVFGGNLYFSADSANGLGRELRMLGSATTIDIFPGAGSSYPTGMAVYNNALYFGANGGDGFGSELWKYDTVNGPVRVVDIYVGPGSSNPNHLTVYNNILYFQANGNDGAGDELWQYDPVNGALRAANIASGVGSSGPAHMVVYDNVLYFQANALDGTGFELWKYDPVNGAQLVVDLYPGVTNSYPWFLTVYAGAIYFVADGNNGAGRELWKYDTVFGAQLAADIEPGPTGSDPWWLGTYNGKLYFSRNFKMWSYDPLNGVDQVPDFNCGVNLSYDPQALLAYNNELYMNLDCNDGFGRELYRYNTTATGIFRPAKSQDGWLLESSENSEAGGTLNASQPAFNLGDGTQDRQYRSILSFDTSPLPDTAVIVAASLRIRRQGVVGTNPFTTHGNILLDIINGAFSGSNSLQTSDFQAAPGKTGAGVIKNFPDLNNWFTGKLAKTAFPYFNKTGITQLRLRFAKDDNDDNGADYLRFFSADTLIVTDFPLLEVKYYIP